MNQPLTGSITDPGRIEACCPGKAGASPALDRFHAMNDAAVSADLRFAFKGDRNYVHGTDMYRAIVLFMQEQLGDTCLEELSDFRLLFRKPVHHHCIAGLTARDTPDSRPDDVPVEFRFCLNDRFCTGWLQETRQPVVDRYAYDETNSLKCAQVSAQTARLPITADFTIIEQLVSTTKALHQTLFPDTDGHWFFSRLDLPGLLPDTRQEQISVTLEQNLGQRLTRSAISMDGRECGRIYFSLVNS